MMKKNKLSTITDKLEDVRREGDGLVAKCPAHDDRHASLRIGVKEGGKALLKCRAGCQTEAVLAAAGLTFADLFNVEVDVEGAELTTAGGGSLPVYAMAQAAAYLAWAAWNYAGSQAEAYALARFGVSPELGQALGLGYDPGPYVVGDRPDMALLGALYTAVPRLVVPFRDADGVARGFQARDLVGTSKAKWAGPSNPPEGGAWGKVAVFSASAGSDFLVVTEGPGDALVAVGAGIDAAGIRGASLAKAAVADLASILQGRRVVLAGDGDAAGARFNAELAVALSAAGVAAQLLQLPPDVGDLGEWYEADPPAFAAAFQAAAFRAPAFATAVPEGPSEAEPEMDTTDLGVARLVAAHFQGRLAHVPGIGFHIYEGGVWRPDTLKRTRATVYEVSDQLAEQATSLLTSGRSEDRDRAKVIQAASRRLRNGLTIDRVMKELETLTATPLERFDQHPDRLVVKNGVVDLRTGELGQHDPELFITQRVDVNYRPDARADRWERFLGEVMPAAPITMPAYLQRLIGYGITGETVEQSFAVLWGRGANGKSVFTETLSHVFAGITQTTPFATFEDKPSGGIPNDLAALRGARLVFASEGERGAPMAESVIKRVTGQDTVTARFMRQEFFSFKPTFLILLATNHKPAFRSADEGLWRRVKLVPWARYFAEAERDHYLTQKLKAETEGILAWAVRGAVAWYAEGLQDPETVRTATKGYRDTSDALGGFWLDLLRPEKGSTVDGGLAYKAYLAWAEREELPPKEVWGRRAFYSGLEERGVERVKKERGIVLLDVTMEPAAVAEPEKAPEVAPPSEDFGGLR